MKQWQKIRAAYTILIPALMAVSAGISGAAAAAAQEATKGPQAAQDTAAVRRELEKAFGQEAQLWKRKDPKAVRAFYETLLAPEFTDTSPDWVLKRKDFLNDMEQNAREVRSVELSQKLEKLTVQGAAATAVVRSTEKGILSDHRGKKHRFNRVALFRQIWTRPGDRWTLKRRELVKEESFTVDGKSGPGR